MSFKRCLAVLLSASLALTPVAQAAAPPAPAATAALPNPILFVTQVPVTGDFTAVASVFGNHQPMLQETPRGGDLWIRYPDGTQKNLTQLAGYGSPSGFQGPSSISVREPSVHWTGTKALFSMVIGAPAQQYVWETYRWQIYEVTGLGQADTPVITKIPNQPAFNNVSPFYGTDERILFTSDRPRGGEAHLYPQLDEYEEAPTVTGLFSLDRATGDLRLLNHSPSGVFSPSVDSYGRVVFTRWDHLQRDQQADADFDAETYGTFNYADETAGAARLNSRAEVFPEPRSARTDLLQGTNLEGHSLNQFFPWTVNEDGTEEETLNHVGRHDLTSYFNRALNDDPNLVEFISAVSGRVNQNPLNNLLQMKEDPTSPGTYYGIDAPEFYTHAAGQVVKLTAPPSLAPDQIQVTYVTHRDTANPTDSPDPTHSGLYRNPLPLSDGTVLAVHAGPLSGSPETRIEYNSGTRANPASRYAFRIRTLVASGSVKVAGAALTTGITKSVSFWDPDVLVSWSGTLWELDPVEVKARTKPPARTGGLQSPELAVFSQEGVDPAAFKAYLASKGLALIVSRNVTTRDKSDRQQPFNLKVNGSATQTVGAGGKIYTISDLQIFQADQIRGIGGTTDPRAGRRVLAQVLHDPAVKNPPNPTGPAGSVKIAADGSMAAFVPARRAASWQLTDPTGVPVVRERYWLTFQPGEVRLCSSCHGLSSKDQANHVEPTNQPEALRQVLQYYKSVLNPNGPAGASFYTVTPCRVADTRAAEAPALSGASTRALVVEGKCGIPASASAISANLTVTSPGASGNLRAFPADVSPPSTSVLNFRPGQTRANNLQLTLSADGQVKIYNDSPASVQIILDVNGYWQ